MRMAKATDDDIKAVSDFFNMMETLNDPFFDIEDWVDDENYEMYKACMDTRYKGQVDFNAFIGMWLHKIDTKWRRVVGTCVVLLENCADPNLDYCEFRPDIKAFLDSQEVK